MPSVDHGPVFHRVGPVRVRSPGRCQGCPWWACCRGTRRRGLWRQARRSARVCTRAHIGVAAVDDERRARRFVSQEHRELCSRVADSVHAPAGARRSCESGRARSACRGCRVCMRRSRHRGPRLSPAASSTIAARVVPIIADLLLVKAVQGNGFRGPCTAPYAVVVWGVSGHRRAGWSATRAFGGPRRCSRSGALRWPRTVRRPRLDGRGRLVRRWWRGRCRW